MVINSLSSHGTFSTHSCFISKSSLEFSSSIKNILRCIFVIVFFELCVIHFIKIDLKDIKILRGRYGGYGRELNRVMNLMAREQKWIPGRLRKKKVNFEFTISIKIDDDQINEINNTFLSLEEAKKRPNKVHILRLGQRGLTSLPKYIGKFINLKELHLSKNPITKLRGYYIVAYSSTSRNAYQERMG